jgi:signal transduction histidine kinase
VRDGAQRCLDLITKIRRSEEAKDQPLSPVDLIPILKGEINLLNRLYDIELEVSGIPNSLFVLADSALSQMLWNLMENSVKHNPKEERKIWIKGKMKSGTFTLSISDNGPGIGPAERTQIFQEVRRFGGVGLHIVRQLVHKYGAKLDAKDRIDGYTNEGLEVIITFQTISPPSE